MNGAEQIAVELGEFIGRDRKFGEIAACLGLQDDLPLGPPDVPREDRDQLLGRITEFADMEIIGIGIIVGTGGYRRAAEGDGLFMPMRSAADVVDLPTLNMHAADEHGIGPGEIAVLGRLHILVDEAHIPMFRQGGGNDEQALRRHESFDACRELIGIFKGAEGGRVAREDAENAPLARVQAPLQLFLRLLVRHLVQPSL